ncbi:MAG: hypothetical protein FWE42_05010, partial [Defluviitaleaceae bacterium]|nr:hypothetical protein [Defluviitaleaceae bacterium]
YANQGGFFDACQEGKLEKADAEWRKSDRQSDIEPYEHSFLDPVLEKVLALCQINQAILILQNQGPAPPAARRQQ